MKKSLFIVALAATALTGCRKDDSFVNTPNNEQKGEPIALQFTSPVSVTTRSTGAVGDLAANTGTNIWKGQELKVFMLKTATKSPATEEYYTETVDKYQGVEKGQTKTADIFYNTTVTAPTDIISGKANYGYMTKYYPNVGVFDFFAYHADDAVTSDQPDSTSIEGVITVDVEINGSQDLMVAKAALTEEQAQNNELVDDVKGNMYYSAYAARRGVQPNFKFQHLLSRFVFNVIPGNEKSAGLTGIRIDSIYVLGVPNKATMVVASVDTTAANNIYTNEFNVDNFLTWEESTATMFLQDRVANEMVTLEPEYLEWENGNGVKETIGESLLLPADTTQYTLVIEYSERPNAADTANYQALYEAALKEAYLEAKTTAFEDSMALAKADSMLVAMRADSVLARQAAFEKAMETAKQNAFKNNENYDASSWTWKNDATGEPYTVENWPGSDVWEADWEWPYEESWSNSWVWKKPNGDVYTVENWTWKNQFGRVIDESTWEWDGKDEWNKNFYDFVNRVYKNTVTAKLALGTDLKFEAGMQYNVNFTVYSLEEITLTMQLTGWENGGDLNFDNDSPFEPIEVTYGGVEVGGNTSPLE